MATFLTNEIHTTDRERDLTGPTAHVQIIFSLKDNLVPRVFVPLDQGRKTRALGATILK